MKMRKKLKTCFMLMVVVSTIGLFFCSKAIAMKKECEERRAENAKKPPITLYRNPDGTLTTNPPARIKYVLRAPRVTAMEKPSVVKKEAPIPIPICIQAANLRKAFEKIPMDGNEETNNALQKSFEAQSAKIIHDWCQEQKGDILKMVGEGFPNKNAVVAKVQIIATDEYKKAALGFLKSCNPRVKLEVSRLQKMSNPIDVNNSISFDLSSWQSKRHPVNPHYVGHILDKFSDSNNPAKIEAVRIYNTLVMETELLDSVTANLSVMPIEDVNTITETKQPESTESPAPLELPVSTITKTD